MNSIADIAFMRRCIELADNGLGYVAPNPLVGSVVVHQGRIIGEGYHHLYGQQHAEAAAIAAVDDKSLLAESTLYVSLEPCSHQGKQPPCADLIIRHKIPRAVIASQDPFHQVNGSGIQRLKEAGIDVHVGVLEKEAQEQNRRFFTYHRYHRPYIILKWAQTLDGFIDKERGKNTPPEWLTGNTGQLLVHRWRTEEQAIMVGANTVLRDNPKLTARLWPGKNPLRVIVDNDLSLPANALIFDSSAPTVLFTTLAALSSTNYNNSSLMIKRLNGSNMLEEQLLNALADMKVQSVIVEGGRKLLERFIEKGFWDEARIFTAPKRFGNGVKSPDIQGTCIADISNESFSLNVLRNKQAVGMLNTAC